MAETTTTTTETPPPTPPAPEPASIEKAADTAKEIAQVEADANVTIAALNAETEQARIAAQAKNDKAAISAGPQFKEELDQCRMTITSLQTETAELRSALSSIQQALTPKPPSPSAAPPDGESARTPESLSPKQESTPPPQSPPRSKGRKWI